MRKIFTFFLALIVGAGTLFAETKASGTCGEHLTWDLTGEVLTISGTGDMAEWDETENIPWYSNRLSVKSVIIGNGVTSISERAFRPCTYLASVTIPNTVKTIGGWAFYNCIKLTSVTIPNSVTTIGSRAFDECPKLTSVVLGEGLTSIGVCAFAERLL